MPTLHGDASLDAALCTTRPAEGRLRPTALRHIGIFTLLMFSNTKKREPFFGSLFK